MDTETLERFARGDLDAFEAVFRSFQGEVWGWIVRLVRDPAAAEDLTLETFWRIYRSHAHFDPRRGFGPWAHRIAIHVALSHLKSRQPEIELTGDVAAAAAGGSGELHAAVRRAVAGLPPKLEAVAALALIEERPYAEIAKMLGISPEAVKSREFRAVRLLRKKLTSWGVHP
jgi:RNA polymerase sigma-70 factor (ECF subfamily)